MNMKWTFKLAIATATVATGNFLSILSAGTAQAIVIDFDEAVTANVCGSSLSSSGKTLPGCVKLTDQYQAAYGITFATNTKELWLFDTDCDPNQSVNNGGCTGDDPDLATGKDEYISGNLKVKYDTPQQGHALIIQENTGSQKQPDDNAGGGTISMLFDTPVIFKNLGFLDLDEASIPKFTFFFADGSNSGELQFTDSDPEVSIVTGTGSLGPNVSSKEQPKNGGAYQYNKNNSLRNYAFDFNDVVKVNVRLPGSGAIPYLEYEQEAIAVPEPSAALVGLGLLGLGWLSRKKR